MQLIYKTSQHSIILAANSRIPHAIFKTATSVGISVDACDALISSVYLNQNVDFSDEALSDLIAKLLLLRIRKTESSDTLYTKTASRLKGESAVEFEKVWWTMDIVDRNFTTTELDMLECLGRWMFSDKWYNGLCYMVGGLVYAIHTPAVGINAGRYFAGEYSKYVSGIYIPLDIAREFKSDRGTADTLFKTLPLSDLLYRYYRVAAPIDAVDDKKTIDVNVRIEITASSAEEAHDEVRKQMPSIAHDISERINKMWTNK